MAEQFVVPRRLYANDTDTIVAESAADAVAIAVSLMGLEPDEDGYRVEDFSALSPSQEWTLQVEDEDDAVKTVRELIEAGVKAGHVSVRVDVDTRRLAFDGVVRGVFRVKTSAYNWSQLSPRFLGSTEF